LPPDPPYGVTSAESIPLLIKPRSVNSFRTAAAEQPTLPIASRTWVGSTLQCLHQYLMSQLRTWFRIGLSCLVKDTRGNPSCAC
jgi:hypothetical protein